MARKRKQTSADLEASEATSGDSEAAQQGEMGDVLASTAASSEPGDGALAGGAEATDADGSTDGDVSTSPADKIIRDAAVASVNGQHVDVSDSAVVSLAAGSVEANDTLILVGAVGKLGGNARVLVDSRSALVFGIVAGLVLAVFGALLRGGSDDAE